MAHPQPKGGRKQQRRSNAPQHLQSDHDDVKQQQTSVPLQKNIKSTGNSLTSVNVCEDLLIFTDFSNFYKVKWTSEYFLEWDTRKLS